MRKLAFVGALLGAGCGVFLASDGDDEDGQVVFPSPSNDGSADGTNGLANDGSGADATDGALAPNRRVVFVTERTVAGNFGGIAGGDAICAAEAADAGLGGQFVAWVSNGSDDFDARSRFVTDAGWSLTNDGGEVFSGPSAMANVGGPKVGIARNARGETVSGQVWTGLWGDGVRYGKDCAGWTTTQNDGVPGDIGATTASWTGAAPDFCIAEKRLYCFQK